VVGRREDQAVVETVQRPAAWGVEFLRHDYSRSMKR
jgi:hypothetical protein